MMETTDCVFVMESTTFDDLCVSLSQLCVCAGHWKLHSTKQVSSLLHTSYKSTCVYLCVPCIQVLTLVYLIYMQSIDIYLCLLRLPHCMRSTTLPLFTYMVYIYVVPVSQNFILTMMIKLEVMMNMRRMTVTMTWMVTDCISTMMMKITREMKTKMMYKYNNYDETLKVRIITMTHQKLTQSPCTVFLGDLGIFLGLPACALYKIISLSSVHSIKLQHLFYTHSLTFNTQVDITSRTSSTQVRRAFLAKYWSCRHTPRSFRTVQNLWYSGYCGMTVTINIRYYIYVLV